MKWKDYLYIPFPRPRNNKKNVLLIILIGLSASVFILLYEPFGIENTIGEWHVNLVIFSLGIIFIFSVLFIEFYIPKLLPHFFNRWTLGKALFWYPLVIVFVGGVQFLYKSWWGGWHDFTMLEFIMVLGRTLGIGLTVTFFVLGVWQFFNRNRLSQLTSREKYKIITSDGKTVILNISEVLYIASDDNYVDIHLQSGEPKQKKIVLRSSLKNIEAQLSHPLSPIHRCHRQYLINVHYFYIVSENHRKMKIGMEGEGPDIPVSQKYRDTIKKKLQFHP